MRLILVFVLLLAGCAATNVAVLRHSGTGQTVKCGPYLAGGRAADAGAAREARCISDYQRQGFKRVPQ